MVCLSVIEEIYRGGLGPIGLSSQKNCWVRKFLFQRFNTDCRQPVCVDTTYCYIISLNMDINSKQRQFVPRRKHSSVTKIYRLILYRKIIVVCCKLNIKGETLNAERRCTVHTVVTGRRRAKATLCPKILMLVSSVKSFPIELYFINFWFYYKGCPNKSPRFKVHAIVVLLGWRHWKVNIICHCCD